MPIIWNEFGIGFTEIILNEVKVVLKKLFPFQQKATEKEPLHAGEVYYLWETLTGGYKLIEIAEIYLMNSEDEEMQLFLKAISSIEFMLVVKRLEEELKKEGFTVPPRPSSKTRQGTPGVGQEVKLSDEEVIRNITSIGQMYLLMNARAVTVCTRASIRKIFIDLMSDYIMAYRIILGIGLSRQAFDPPPPATARKDSLNIWELSHLWNAMTARYSSQINLEVYLANTKDKELTNLIKWGLNEFVMPQINELEKVIKNEGLTVPQRPVIRTEQYMEGQVNKIRSSDSQVLGAIILASQGAIQVFVSGFNAAFRGDILDLFQKYLFKEFESLTKMITIAQSRKSLQVPPIVSSLRL